MPGISAVSPPMSAQPAVAQPSAIPSMIRGGHVDIELAGREVVEEEERLGPLADKIVDAHRDEVDADGVDDAGVDRDAKLGADTVGRGDEDRIAVARGLEVEERAEPAEPAHDARPQGAPRGGLDPLDQRVAGVDIDARVGIGEARLLGHGTSVRPAVARALHHAREGDNAEEEAEGEGNEGHAECPDRDPWNADGSCRNIRRHRVPLDRSGPLPYPWKRRACSSMVRAERS